MNWKFRYCEKRKLRLKEMDTLKANYIGAAFAMVLAIGTLTKILVTTYISKREKSIQDVKKSKTKRIKKKRKHLKHTPCDNNGEEKEASIVAIPNANDNPKWASAIFFPCFYPELEDSSFQQFQNYLNYAKKSLKVCVMTVTDEALVKLLIKKHKSGVRVMVFTSFYSSDPQKMFGGGKEKYKRNMNPLKTSGCGIEVQSLPKGSYSTEMHHKYAIVDDFAVLTGSINWTNISFLQQRENIMVTTDERYVPLYIENFDMLWGKGKVESSSSSDDE